MTSYCSACGKLFGGVYAFDRHRIKDRPTGARRCRTDEEIQALGFTARPRKAPAWLTRYAQVRPDMVLPVTAWVQPMAQSRLEVVRRAA